MVGYVASRQAALYWFGNQKSRPLVEFSQNDGKNIHNLFAGLGFEIVASFAVDSTPNPVLTGFFIPHGNCHDCNNF
jgi:hypothetical protein